MLTQTPVLDGRVLDDPAWHGLPVISDFTQVRPVEGAAASARTEVRIGFTPDTLYLSVVCFDDAPEDIIVSSSRRDADLAQEDSFRFVIDAFRSEQDGFVFGTNPAGIEYDGQLQNAEANRIPGSTGFDLNWDTTWDVATARGDYGWSAEFAIPFKSLRYGAATDQIWNMNFQRNLRGINEVAYWAPIPVQFGLNRLSLAGSISGIAVPEARNLQITPYALASTSRGGTPSVSEDDTEAGVDLKYSITPSLTLDLTYNTDFAQVEVDQQQINLNRFSLFFPEKRPFFLENASQFSVGLPEQLELFFSRRIGIGAGGQQLPIDGGVRLSGKLGDSTNVGLLHMRSEAVRDVAEETDFTVVRVREELANRSSLGALIVNRDDETSDNQTYALDGAWGLGEDSLISGFVAKTETDGINDDDHAIHVKAASDSQLWSYSASYTEVGAGFNPEVGFLTRQDYRQASLFALRRVRFRESSSVLEMRPHASYDGYWNFDGYYETGRVHLDHSTEWKSGAQLHTALNLTHEGVQEPFDIVRGVTVQPGEYDNEELSVFAGTDKSAPLSFDFNFVWGGFFSGNRVTASPSVTYRFGETFNASLSVNHNDVDLDEGDFQVTLTQLRLSYAFTPKMSIQALVQHNDRDKLLASNLRFSWLRSANSGLFIVYNETEDRLNSPGRPRREFIVKYSHIFDI